MGHEPGSRYEWLDEHVDEIVERYVEEGQSLREIANHFGVSAPTIQRRLHENDVSTSRGGPQYVQLNDKVDEIVERYVDERESLQSIADDYGTAAEPIKRRLQEADVELRSTKRKTVDIGFSPYQVSVIQGELLGDGCLYKQGPGSCFFQMSNTIKKHTLRVMEKLPDDLFPDTHPYSVTRSDGYGPEYTNWIISSRLQPLFREMYSDWYEEHDDYRRKVVPEDYRLDETALLHWFWGDGCCSIRESGAPRVEFATHGFPEESVETLQRGLDWFGYDNYTIQVKGVDNGSGLVIRLSDVSARDFLEDLRPRNSIAEYDYKFPVPES